MEEFNLKRATLSKFDDSVIFIEFKESNEITVDDLKSVETSVVNAFGKNPYYSITTLPYNFKNFNEEAKDFLIDENLILKNRIMDCFVTESLSKRLGLELFFQLYKPTRKTKIFNSINKALTYIKNQKEIEVTEKGVLV